MLLWVDNCSATFERYQVLDFWATVEAPNASVLTVQEYTTQNSSSDALNTNGCTTIS